MGIHRNPSCHQPGPAVPDTANDQATQARRKPECEDRVMAVRELVDQVRETLRSQRDAERAPAMKAYMRDQFEFLGIASPRLKVLIRGLKLPKLADKELASLVTTLWQEPEREYQYVALSVLRRDAKKLDKTFIETAESLIVTKSWWDTVDELAQHLVGVLVQSHTDLVPTMDVWVENDNMWLARTAILHQNRYKGQTDVTRLFSYCERQAGHPDFFIRKAIGWALREYAKTDPEAVRDFVKRNDDRLSGLSKREALKNIG